MLNNKIIKILSLGGLLGFAVLANAQDDLPHYQYQLSVKSEVTTPQDYDVTIGCRPPFGHFVQRYTFKGVTINNPIINKPVTPQCPAILVAVNSQPSIAQNNGKCSGESHTNDAGWTKGSLFQMTNIQIVSLNSEDSNGNQKLITTCSIDR